jgi:hypothetical protein
MKVHELLNDKVVISELKGRSKEDIINELVDLFKTIPELQIWNGYGSQFLSVKK